MKRVTMTIEDQTITTLVEIGDHRLTRVHTKDGGWPRSEDGSIDEEIPDPIELSDFIDSLDETTEATFEIADRLGDMTGSQG